MIEYGNDKKIEQKIECTCHGLVEAATRVGEHGQDFIEIRSCYWFISVTINQTNEYYLSWRKEEKEDKNTNEKKIKGKKIKRYEQHERVSSSSSSGHVACARDLATSAYNQQ